MLIFSEIYDGDFICASIAMAEIVIRNKVRYVRCRADESCTAYNPGTRYKETLMLHSAYKIIGKIK